MVLSMCVPPAKTSNSRLRRNITLTEYVNMFLIAFSALPQFCDLQVLGTGGIDSFGIIRVSKFT